MKKLTNFEAYFTFPTPSFTHYAAQEIVCLRALRVVAIILPYFSSNSLLDLVKVYSLF